MFSTRAFIEQETARIDYLDFVDQNVTGLSGKMRPMPREVENRIIYDVNSAFRRAFYASLAAIVSETFTSFREDADAKKNVNQIDEFFSRNGLTDVLASYYKSKGLHAYSFASWYYDCYLTQIEGRILEVSRQLASRMANNLNQIAEHAELDKLVLCHDDFGPDGFPKRTPEVEEKRTKLVEFLKREYTQVINEKIREIVEGSGQMFADPVLEAVEDLVGMKSKVRSRLIRVIERRHDGPATVNGAAAECGAALQSSHFEDLAHIVTKAIGVSEYLNAQLTHEKGDEIRRELDQLAAAADTINTQIEKDAADFASRIERWAA